MLPVQVVSKELIQFYQCFMGPDLLYSLFDDVGLKIFCFKTEFFCEIEYMSSTRHEIIEVPKNSHNQQNSFNHIDKLLI